MKFQWKTLFYEHARLQNYVFFNSQIAPENEFYSWFTSFLLDNTIKGFEWNISSIEKSIIFPSSSSTNDFWRYKDVRSLLRSHQADFCAQEPQIAA